MYNVITDKGSEQMKHIEKIMDSHLTLAQASQIIEECGLWYFLERYTFGSSSSEDAMEDIMGV